MPTLLRYKKAYQRRIPAVGKGRTQRYPASALKVFKEIKKENLAKRGRPAKKKAAAKKRKKPPRNDDKSQAERPADAVGDRSANRHLLSNAHPLRQGLRQEDPLRRSRSQAALPPGGGRRLQPAASPKPPGPQEGHQADPRHHRTRHRRRQQGTKRPHKETGKGASRNRQAARGRDQAAQATSPGHHQEQVANPRLSPGSVRIRGQGAFRQPSRCLKR